MAGLEGLAAVSAIDFCGTSVTFRWWSQAPEVGLNCERSAQK